jgi:hypothetical protein
MAGQLNVFGMASQGVNTDLNDVNMEDGMLRKAQNAIHDPTGAMGSLRKRPGLLKVNSNAVTGSVFNICNVPIAPITTRRFLVGVDQAIEVAYQWITSTDEFGTTATATTPGAVSSGAGATSWIASTNATLSNRGCQGEGFILYPGSYTRGNPQPVRIYDGTVDRELFQIPLNAVAFAAEGAANYASSTGEVLQMLLVDKKLYIVTHDFSLGAAPHYGRILEYDFETGALQQIGNGCSSASGDIGTGGNDVFTCVAFHQGYLYAGVGPVLSGEGSAGAGVYRIRPGVDATWTYDFDNSSAGEERPMSMASYKGKLYVGMHDLNTASQRIVVRDYAGAYSSSTTQGTLTGSAWVDMLVFGDNLYATSYDANGASGQTRIHKFDGSSWSVVKTIDSATSTPRIGVAMLVHNGKLYVLGINTNRLGIVTYTSDGTSWTDQTTNLDGLDVVSVFGVLTD